MCVCVCVLLVVGAKNGRSEAVFSTEYSSESAIYIRPDRKNRGIQPHTLNADSRMGLQLPARTPH